LGDQPVGCGHGCLEAAYVVGVHRLSTIGEYLYGTLSMRFLFKTGRIHEMLALPAQTIVASLLVSYPQAATKLS
jgi:hypothetical protein